MSLWVLNPTHSQSTNGLDNIAQSEELVVETVTVRFDESRRPLSLREVGRDSINLAKIDYVYDQLLQDLDLRLRINVFSDNKYSYSGFDITYHGARNLTRYFGEKDLNVLNVDFFYSMEVVDLTKEEVSTPEALARNCRVEFILFK